MLYATVVVRPYLGHAVQFWSPYHKMDIKMLKIHVEDNDKNPSSVEKLKFVLF